MALSALVAQERFSAIGGKVKDASGGLIPDAGVTLINKSSNRTTSVTTDAAGAYLARQVEPGRYRVIFEKPGFARAEAADVLVLLGQEVEVSVTLELGATAATIQVTEAAPLIDLGGAARMNNVTLEEFSRLPKARSFQSVAAFSPSVNSGQLEGGYQINGASGSENQYFIDGVSTNSLIDGRSRQNSAYEFLQEVQVKTAGIDAEYGGALGGVVNAVTRSGGNAFHGEAHYYYSGNGIGAGPVKRLLLLNPFSNLGVNPSYQQDFKSRNRVHELGGSLGGYFIKNRLWFFTSYSPQIVRRSNDYLFSNGLEPDTLTQEQTSQQLFNKLSWNPAPALRVNLSWLWTPMRTKGLLPAYNGYGNSVLTGRASAQPLKTQGWTQPQSNYSGQIDWSLSSTSLVTVRAGRFWDNFRTWGVPPVSSVTFQAPSTNMPELPAAMRLPAGTYNTPRIQTTFYDITTRTYYQVDFNKYVSGWFGSHDIKTGGGTQKGVNRMDISYPGGGYVFVFWNTPLQRNDGSSDRGAYGYYEVHNLGTRGTTGGTMSNLYLQDRWRPHPRLTLTLGLRTENEHVPSFDRRVRDDAFAFGFSQKLSPRLGASWDVFGKGAFKIYGSYGRYYDWVKYEASRGTFGGDFWSVRYRSLDTPDAWSLSGANMPGRNIWNQEYESRRLPAFEAVAPGLKPMATDLFNVGAEYQAGASTVIRAGYVRNRLVRTIEDLGALVNGDEVYMFANPGEGAAKMFFPSSATPAFETPKPVRTYDAVEFVVTRRFAKRFFGSASYVWSRLYGNYAGLGNSDEISPPTVGTSMGTTQQSGGSIARPGSTGSRAWDSDQYLFDSKGNFVEGRLATDRPHVFKLYGAYQFACGTDVGGFFTASSGTPLGTVVHQLQRIPLFVNGRGDMGRTPAFNQTDLLVGHEVKLGETRRLRFEFNAQNVFNQKTARHVFSQLNRGAATGYPAAALNLARVNLFEGYDYRALLDAKKAQGTDPYDPRYGMADIFNPGFQGRVMVKFTF